VVKLARFRVLFEEEAGEFLVSIPKRKARRLLDVIYVIADSPFMNPDYILPDAEGRSISHIMTEGYLITYWIDAPMHRLVVVELEENF